MPIIKNVSISLFNYRKFVKDVVRNNISRNKNLKRLLQISLNVVSTLFLSSFKTSYVVMEPLNALYIASRRNSERCHRQFNVATFALPSADISLRRRSLVGREAGGRERERANGERNLKQILDITEV